MAASSSSVGVTTDLTQGIQQNRRDGAPNAELRSALLALIDEADGEIPRARRNVEWYAAMMDRVPAGKAAHDGPDAGARIGRIRSDRRGHVSLAQSLAPDGAHRRSVAAAAEQSLATPQQPPAAPAADPEERQKAATERSKAAYGNVEALGLPMGWVRDDGTDEEGT